MISGVQILNHSPDSLSVCAGFSHCGTTTLRDLMKQHPQVSVSFPKETDFFIKEPSYVKRTENYVAKYFRPNSNTSYLFESNPAYIENPAALANMKKHYPKLKIILIIRNPVERLLTEIITRHPALDSSPDRSLSDQIREFIENENQFLFYSAQIKKIFQILPRHQIYFLVFEHFIVEQQNHFSRICDWLDIDSIKIKPVKSNQTRPVISPIFQCLLRKIQHKKFDSLLRFIIPGKQNRNRLIRYLGKLNTHPLKNKPALDFHERKRLLKYLDPEIRELEKLTGEDLSFWS